jgi:hypothetical protein
VRKEQTPGRGALVGAVHVQEAPAAPVPAVDEEMTAVPVVHVLVVPAEEVLKVNARVAAFAGAVNKGADLADLIAVHVEAKGANNNSHARKFSFQRSR